MQLLGWVESCGKRLTGPEVEAVINEDPRRVAGFGGEFSLSWDGCKATDRLGILGLPGPLGVITCHGEVIG